MAHEPSAETPSVETLTAWIDGGRAAELEGWLAEAERSEVVHELARLDGEHRGRLVDTLEPELAARVIDLLPDSQALDALGEIEPESAARVLEELPSDECADLIGELDEPEAEAILAELEQPRAEELRRLVAYESNEAGGLMVTEFLVYREDQTVAQVLDDLLGQAERYRRYDIQYAYVVDDDRRLVGVLPLRDLLLAERSTTLTRCMRTETVSVDDHCALVDVASTFRKHGFLGLPVVDADGRLVGVIERVALQEALADEADDTYRASQGIVGGEELRSMPLWQRARRRLSWLSVNIVLNVIAASVIAANQDVLEQVIALAVFLPIISDMSGCSGNQAVAVSMRELSLGVTRPADLWRVITKELAVGLLNGLALGALIGATAWIWQGNPWLGLVVGLALALNTLLAVTVGGAVPLLLKRMGQDPAVGAGPLLTTVTDMCGFFLVLTLASQLLSRL